GLGLRRRTRLLRRHRRRLIRSSGRLGRHYALPVKLSRLGRGCNRRTSVIRRRKVLLVLTGHVFVLGLRRQRYPVVLVLRHFLFVIRTRRNPALASVERHVILVHDYRLVVD